MKPLATAQPSWREFLLGVLLIFPLAALLISLFGTQALDFVFPSLLVDVAVATPEDFAANRLRMLIVFVISWLAVVGWSTWVNRKHRVYAVYEDRLTVGSPVRITLPFEELTRIRVGAPMTKLVARVAQANDLLGVVSAKNRGAADHLRHGLANTVVLDTAEQSLVIHLGTVEGAGEVFQALVEQNPGKLLPAMYTEAELAGFGRFTPGLYPRQPSSRSGRG